MTRPASVARAHALCAWPRRDYVVTVAMVALTAAVFVAVGHPASRPTVDKFDRAFLDGVLGARNGILTAVALVLNVVGSGWGTAVARIAAAIFLGLRHRWWHVTSFLAAVVIAEVSISSLKVLFDRSRPGGSLVATSGGSFPSGHAIATSVTVIALVIAAFPDGPRRYRWGVAAVLFASAMALSRSYLAAHWLSDAVGGTLLGTTIALVAAIAVDALRRHLGPAIRAPIDGRSASNP